jgi:opacity protein-like surface antigen
MLLALALLAGPLTSAAGAQDVPPPAAELSIGWVGFSDDGIVNETMVGGTVRYYLTPQLGVGPEFVYMKGPSHSHLMVTGNVTYDLLPPAGRRLVTPYLVAGGGVFQTRQQFPRGTFKSNEGAFTAGGGLRFTAEDRLIVGAEARVGWELHLRVNGFIGLQF